MKISEAIQQCEQQIEAALWSLEVPGENEKALEAYRQVQVRLDQLPIPAEGVEYQDHQRVLAFCLMRQANILRQIGQTREAYDLSQQEIAAARRSGDEIALARSLMSNGASHLAAGETEHGLALLDEAGELFQRGSSYDYQQGLGWYWILQADLITAGYIQKSSQEVIPLAERALSLLISIENWPGVARAYEARAKAYENLGETEAAERDRQSQQEFQAKVPKKGFDG